MTLASSLGPWVDQLTPGCPPGSNPWVANEAIPSPSRRLADQNGGAGGQNLPKVYLLWG